MGGTAVRRLMMEFDARDRGAENTTSAPDQATLLHALLPCELALGTLSRQQFNDGLPSLLPDDVVHGKPSTPNHSAVEESRVGDGAAVRQRDGRGHHYDRPAGPAAGARPGPGPGGSGSGCIPAVSGQGAQELLDQRLQVAPFGVVNVERIWSRTSSRFRAAASTARWPAGVRSRARDLASSRISSRDLGCRSQPMSPIVHGQTHSAETRP